MTTNIATTKEQSVRLLQCGVDPKTADMCYQFIDECCNNTDNPICSTPKEQYATVSGHGFGDHRIHITPAWSLSALLALLPEKIEGGYWLTIQKCSRAKNEPVYYGIAYFKCKWDNPEDISNSTITTLGRLKYFTDRNLIEAVCKMIEWLTANNYKLNQL